MLTYVLALSLAAVTAPAPGQQPGAKPAPASPLSGPSVEKRPESREKTLIERDMSGKIVRLELSVHEAALRLIDLDDETRAKAEAALLRRTVLLDGIVRDNLKLLVELAGARQADDREGAARLLAELAEKARPLRDLGPLQQQLQALMTPSRRNEFVKLTQDYWNAVIEERQAEAKAAGEKFSLREFIAAERLAAAGAEIRRSYDRVVGQQVRDFEALLRTLDLTPEQESRVRQIVGDSFQNTYGKASPAERARVFAAVYGVLDAQQRSRLLERVREDLGSGGGAERAEPAGEGK